jgi:hypothetical protein
VSARPELHAEEILRRLTARGVDFVVIGGIAAVLWGSARMTCDLDICFATDDINLKALGQVFVDLGAAVKDVDRDQPVMTSAGELHLLARPAGAPSYEALRKRATRVDLGDFNVLISSLDDLIAMNRAAGRSAEVEELEGIRNLT